jgi:hypothetical protein
MFPTRHELLKNFKSPVFDTHVNFPFLRTFSCLKQWKGTPLVELAKLRIDIIGLDYLEFSSDNNNKFESQLKFQQDCYRLWYQVDGTGILQNTTRNSYGTARPGLLGLMERGERHTYLHQKGSFECFQMLFSFMPSQHAKCYWNSEIEGKLILEGNERFYFESLIFDLLLVLSN